MFYSHPESKYLQFNFALFAIVKPVKPMYYSVKETREACNMRETRAREKSLAPRVTYSRPFEKILTFRISQIVRLKEHFPAEITKFYFAFLHVIAPNATKYTTKLDTK